MYFIPVPGATAPMSAPRLPSLVSLQLHLRCTETGLSGLAVHVLLLDGTLAVFPHKIRNWGLTLSVLSPALYRGSVSWKQKLLMGNVTQLHGRRNQSFFSWAVPGSPTVPTLLAPLYWDTYYCLGVCHFICPYTLSIAIAGWGHWGFLFVSHGKCHIMKWTLN